MIVLMERMYKFKPFITTLFLALWFLSVHHCVFEFLINELENTPVSNSSEGSDCASHKSDGSDSHKEGQPCDTEKIVAVQNLEIDFNIILSDFLFIEFQQETHSDFIFETLSSLDYSQVFRFKYVLSSLTAASNAPPYLA